MWKVLHIGRFADSIGLTGNMVGYMVKWMTYGSGLKGDK